MFWTRRKFVLTSAGYTVASALAPGPHAATADSAKRWVLPEKRPFHAIENEWISMSDGVRLGVRLWIPDSADRAPVPVVWEYIPYRKRDFYRAEDDQWASQFVAYGFA